MMRVSVTDVEAYRLYKTQEWFSFDRLLDQLLKRTPPTPAMMAGSAFHKLLETSSEAILEDATVDGFTFDFSALDATVAMPDIREMKATKEYGDITLVGRVDAIEGLRIWDHKLTGDFDADKYMDSYQWRAYLEIFNADRLTYNVFTGREKKGRDFITQEGAVEANWAGVDWIVYRFDPLDCYRYPAMENDVERLVYEFAEFMNKHVVDKAA